MTEKFTPNHLIKFIYKETTLAETIAISEQLDADPIMAEQYHDLLEAYDQLPKVQFKPQQMTIQNILNFSKETSLHQLH